MTRRYKILCGFLICGHNSMLETMPTVRPGTFSPPDPALVTSGSITAQDGQPRKG